MIATIGSAPLRPAGAAGRMAGEVVGAGALIYEVPRLGPIFESLPVQPDPNPLSLVSPNQRLCDLSWRERLAALVFERRVRLWRRWAVTERASARAASKLISLGRFAEADAILQKAQVAFPRRPRLMELYATSAHNGLRHAEAIERWEALRRTSPDLPMPPCGISANARELGQLERATQVMREALRRFPDDFIVLTEASRAFDQSKAYDEAAACWFPLVKRRDIPFEWRVAYFRDLLRLERLDDAKAALATVEGFHSVDTASDLGSTARANPYEQDISFMRGCFAMAQQEWETAAAIWTNYIVRYPDCDAGRAVSFRVEYVRQLADAEQQAAWPEALRRIIVERIENEDIRTLMLRFEGMGRDCEFGSVQRRYGAEPLGLLRWNDVKYPSLLAAMEARFDGMGDPENTDMIVDVIGEYNVVDKRWNLAMHTWIHHNEVPAPALYPKMCRRVAYLRDKFIGDLREGEKTFVFLSDNTSVARLRALHDAMTTYGPVSLLLVKKAGASDLDGVDERPGEITVVRPDLFIGYLEPSSHMHDIAFDNWVDILRAVDARVRRHGKQDASPPTSHPPAVAASTSFR